MLMGRKGVSIASWKAGIKREGEGGGVLVGVCGEAEEDEEEVGIWDEKDILC